MSPPDATAAVARNEATLESLRAAGWAAEVYSKRGRSRRVEAGGGAARAMLAVEEGWAVRAGGPRGAFFLSGTGQPPVAGPWPAPAGAALRLPPALAGDPWRAPNQLDAPLLGESEGRALLDSIERELQAEMPGSKLLSAVIEDGASESLLISSEGARAAWRQRVAWLRAEAAHGAARAAVEIVERTAHGFRPAALARRLADRLHVLVGGRPATRDRGAFLLAPPVGARLLEGLLPALVGPPAVPRLTALGDSRGRVGAEVLTLIDDGRLPGGALAAAVDGEGSPTRRIVLIEHGVARQPLLAWFEAEGKTPAGRPSGCVHRPSWRDVPRPGPTHLFIEPREDVAVTDLLAAVTRGYYLLDATGSARFDFDADRFSLPVCGFSVQAGRAVAPVAPAVLAGAITALLANLEGVARDLAFLPLDGLLGSPTLLVQGLELRPGG